MVCHPFFHERLLLGLLWLCVAFYWLWPRHYTKPCHDFLGLCHSR
jgi:hypothetical protein